MMSPAFTLWLSMSVNDSCRIISIVWSFVTLNSVLHLLVLTIDRYIAVMYSLQYAMIFTPSRLVFSLTLCWLLSAVLAAPGVVGSLMLKVKTSACHTLHLPIQSVYMYIIIIPLIIFMIVMMYVRIYKEIHHQHRQVSSLGGPSSQGHRVNTRSMMVVLLTVGAFVLGWSPLIITLVVAIVKGTTYTSSSCGFYKCLAVTEFLSYLNLLMNPLIYVIRLKQVRKCYIKIFRTLWCFGRKNN